MKLWLEKHLSIDCVLCEFVWEATVIRLWDNLFYSIISDSPWLHVIDEFEDALKIGIKNKGLALSRNKVAEDVESAPNELSKNNSQWIEQEQLDFRYVDKLATAFKIADPKYSTNDADIVLEDEDSTLFNNVTAENCNNKVKETEVIMMQNSVGREVICIKIKFSRKLGHQVGNHSKLLQGVSEPDLLDSCVIKKDQSGKE